MNNSLPNIIVATIREWNIENYFTLKDAYKEEFNFHLFTSSEELNYENVKRLDPKYIFFPHWSWIIDENIYKNFECVVFHMTDLPYGRGGSPLQNLIMNKVYQTKISAIKVDKEMDCGDIYLKEDFDISDGSAEEIFTKASKLVFEKLIPRLLKEEIIPYIQDGKITIFKRRNQLESNLNTLEDFSLNRIYDFIRMLDAKDYPKAFLLLNNCKIEFSLVKKENNKLVGKFEVMENE
jgi:methionyl-tRNA formyltransferase